MCVRTPVRAGAAHAMEGVNSIPPLGGQKLAAVSTAVRSDRQELTYTSRIKFPLRPESRQWAREWLARGEKAYYADHPASIDRLAVWPLDEATPPLWDCKEITFTTFEEKSCNSILHETNVSLC
jgi:hypothetical protein